MSSIDSIIFQLRNGFISETLIPNEYLYVPQIKELIIQYNWITRPSHIFGWTNLVRYRNYSN